MKLLYLPALAAGLEPDLRSFHPHVTVARCRDVSPEVIRPFLKAHAAFDAGLIHVESFLPELERAHAGRFRLHSRIYGPGCVPLKSRWLLDAHRVNYRLSGRSLRRLGA